MKLIHSPTSPYVRKVMVIAKLTGLEGRLELVPGQTSPLEPNPATVEANPLGKVPALVTDDGMTLFDSRVICRYLAAEAGADLYPEARLWEVMTREALADGILDAGILAVYEHRLRPEEIRFAPFRQAQIDKITRALDQLEKDAEADRLAGETRADHIAVACALGYLDLRFDDLGWRERAPKLAVWFEEFATLPAMQETVPA